VTRAVRLILWFTFAAALASALPWVRIDADLSRFVSTEASNAHLNLAAALQRGPGGRLVVITVEAADTRGAAYAGRRLVTELRKSGLFASVHNGDAGLMAAEIEPLIPFRYQLSDRVQAATFSEEQLRASLQQAQAMLTDARAWPAQQVLPQDPTLETLHLAQQWSQGAALPLRHGVWFSRSGERALILATTRASGDDAAGQGLVERTLRAQAQAAHLGDAVKVEFTALGLLAAEARSATRSRVERLGAISALLVTLILYLGYRRLLPVVLSLVPVLLGITAGAIATYAAFGDINVLALAFASILVDEGSDYPSYLLTQARRGEPIGEEARRIWPTLRLAVLTSVAAFAVLLLAQFRGLQQLGLLCSVGLLVSGAAARWLLPDLLDRRATVTWVPPHLAARVSSESAPGRPRGSAILLNVLAGAAALTLILVTGPVWNDDIALINPLPPERIAADRALRGHAGLPLDQAVLVFAGPDSESVLQAQEAWMPELAKMRERGAIDTTQLAALYLPSRRTQLARLAAIPDGTELRRRLEQAARGTDFNVDAFEPFLASAGQARDASLQVAELPDGLYRQRVEGLLMSVDGRSIGIAAVSGSVSRDELLASARQALVGSSVSVEWFEPRAQLSALLSSVRQRLVALMLLCTAVVFVVILADQRSMSRSWRVMLPVVTALMIAAGGVRLIFGPLTVFNVVALLLLLGVLTNYSLFIHSAPRFTDLRQSQAHTVFSLLVAGATTLAVFGALGLSGINVVESVGQTVVVGIIVGLIWLIAARERVPA
jgi:predicted exporter